MKSKYFNTVICCIAILSLTAQAQEHPFVIKNWGHPIHPRQLDNDSASTMMNDLPEKPFSKTNFGLLVLQYTPSFFSGGNQLPMKPVSKMNYVIVENSTDRITYNGSNSLPRIPDSKMNYYDKKNRK